MGALSDVLHFLLTRTAPGAVAGAATGAATSDTDPYSAAVTGGVTGGAISSMLGATKAIPAMARAARIPLGTTSRGARMVGKAMSADELTADEMRGLIDKSRGVSPLFLLPERGANSNLFSRAEEAALSPGGARNTAQKFFNDFIGENPDPTLPSAQEKRVSADVKNYLGQDPMAYETVNKLQDMRAKAAKPAYDKAYETKGIHDETMDDLLHRAEDLGAFGHMKTIATADPEWTAGMPKQVDLPDGSKIYRFDTAHADLIKRGLDTMITQHTNEVTGKMDDTGYAITKLRKAILNRIDDINPDFKAARAEYAGPTETINATKEGRDLLSSPPKKMDEILANYDELSPANQDFYRVGVASAIRDRIMSGVDGQDMVRKFFSNRGMREKLQHVFPTKDLFVSFAKNMDEEMKIAAAKNSIIGNSATARRLIEHTNTLASDPGSIMDLAHLAGGNPVPILARVARMWKGRMGVLDPKTAKAMADILYETDPAKQRAAMDLIEQARRKGHAMDVGTGIVSGAAGAAAGYNAGQEDFSQ